MCYRLVNLIESFETLDGLPEADAMPKFLASVQKLMQGGKIVFTGDQQTMGFDRYKDTMREVIASLNRLASDIIDGDEKKDSGIATV